MRILTLITVMASAFVFVTSVSAEDSASTTIEERLANIERMLAATSQVQPAAYQQLVTQPTVPNDALPYEALPINDAPYQPYPSVPLEPYPDAASEANSLGDEAAFFPCVGDQRPRTDSWRFDFELIPTQSNMSRALFGTWPEDTATALRLNLGYEWQSGFGLRGQVWGFHDVSEPPLIDTELNASSFFFDLYKRFVFDRSEVMIGAGPASGVIEFVLPDGTYSQFAGGGASFFAEGYHPFYVNDRLEFGAVGRARVSVLTGDWEDTTGEVIAPTNGDGMAILEAAWGLEMRRYLGRLEDRYWHLGILAEIQRWDSPWLTQFTYSPVTFTGVNVNFGVTW